MSETIVVIDCVKGDTGLKLGLCGIVEAVAGPLQADSGTSGLAAASTAGIETASSCGSSGSRCYSSPDCCSGMLCIRDNYGDSNSPAHCKDDSCFPAHARVVLEGGVVKPVAQLELGDRVLSVDPATGRHVYSAVYFFGHRDATASSEFITLTLGRTEQCSGEESVGCSLDTSGSLPGSSLSLTASPRHFVPVCSCAFGAATCASACTFSSATYKHMRQVRTGDWVWAAAAATQAGSGSAGAGAELVQVLSVSTEMATGLYNPFTLAGPIVVDGVVASSHSEWALDGVLEAIAPGALKHLPMVYQALMLPLRLAYSVLGTRLWSALLEGTRLQEQLHLLGTVLGGTLTLVAQ